MPYGIEIMSPVGSFESLTAAIQGGAESVYFGVGHMNMRSRSSANFTHNDLKEITRVCLDKGVKTYMALNTVIFDSELDEMKKGIDAAKQFSIDAIIASDLSVLQYALDQKMAVHISTQCNITNLEAVKFFSRFADVMVTARELSLEQVKSIVCSIDEQNITGPKGELIKIEIFVHGALCMAVSGKCYLSLDNFNQSANRGACYQPCRRSYTVKDTDHETELELDNEYIMSPKDLNTIGFIDKIIESGVKILKIEGRGRSPEYVKTVTSCYHEAVNSYFEGCYNTARVERWNERLKSVYNRGFWEGYYLGRKIVEWSGNYGSAATHKKIYTGKVMNYFSKLKVAEIKIESGELKTGDGIVIIGPTTGVIQDTIQEIRVNLCKTNIANKGELISIPISEPVRRSDKVYRMSATG